MEDSKQIVFNIYGGSQQINPTAATAIQNYYGDQFAAEKLREESLNLSDLPPEAQALAVHVSQAGNLPRYVAQLAQCESASALADVAMLLLEQEDKVTAELVVKAAFIKKLLALCPRLTKGNTIDNLRAAINNALAKRPRKRT